MTVGNLGSLGIPAGTSYPSAVDAVKQTNPIMLEQKDTQNFVKIDNTVANRPPEADRYDTGEKPDFAAINLIKNSFPEPMPERRMQSFSLEDFETGAPASGEPRMSLAEFQAQQAEKAQAQQNTQSVQDAVTQPDSGITSTQNSPQQKAFDFEPQTLTQEVRLEERINESATVQTSADIAQESTNSKFTPAQERGAQEYNRVQNYSNPISLSMAGAQIVA